MPSNLIFLLKHRLDCRRGLVGGVLRHCVGVDREGENETRADEDEKAEEETEERTCGVHTD